MPSRAARWTRATAPAGLTWTTRAGNCRGCPPARGRCPARAGERKQQRAAADRAGSPGRDGHIAKEGSPRLDTTVKDVDAAKKVHHERAAGRSNTSSGVPSCSTRPPCRMTTRSATLKASSRSCVTRMGGHADTVMQPAAIAAVPGHLGIEGAERLVQQQHLRLGRQGAGQGHTLPLAARQVARSPLLETLQPHQGQQLADAQRRLFRPVAHARAKATFSKTLRWRNRA